MWILFHLVFQQTSTEHELHIESGPQIRKTSTGPCNLSQTDISLLLQYSNLALFLNSDQLL